MRLVPALGRLVGLALVIAIGMVAAPDAQARASSIEANAHAGIERFRPGITRSSFEYDSTGRLASVSLGAYLQSLHATGLAVTCAPSNAACESLGGSGISESRYLSVLTLEMTGRDGDSITGAVSGRVRGVMLFSHPAAAGYLAGTFESAVDGSATFGCVSYPAMTKLPFADCETGKRGAMLIPVSLDATERGSFLTGRGSGAYGKILTASGARSGHILSSEAGGLKGSTITLSGIRLLTQP